MKREQSERTILRAEQSRAGKLTSDKVPVYANYRKIDGINVDVARTLLSRDYKGFGTGSETSNGVLESN